MNKVTTEGAVRGRQRIKKTKEVEFVQKVVATMPKVREELVEDLRAAIRSGEYNPSAEAIAEKMLLPSPDAEQD